MEQSAVSAVEGMTEDTEAKKESGEMEKPFESSLPVSPERAAIQAVRDEMEEMLDGEMSPEARKEILDAAQAALEQSSLNDPMQAGMEADWEKMTEETRARAMEILRDQLLERERLGLQQEASNIVDNTVLNNMKETVESEMARQVGAEIQQKLQEELRKERMKRAEAAVAKVETLKKTLQAEREQMEKAKPLVRDGKMEDGERQVAGVELKLEEFSGSMEKVMAEVADLSPGSAGKIEETRLAFDGKLAEHVDKALEAIAAKDKSQAVRAVDESERAIRGRMDKLENLQRQIQSDAQKSNSDAVSRMLVAGALPALEEIVEKVVQEQNMDGTSKTVAENIARAIDQRNQQNLLGRGERQAILESKVKERLEKGMSEKPVDGASAFTKTREAHDLVEAGELAKAADLAGNAAEKLESFRRAQSALDIKNAAPADATKLAEAQQAVGEEFEAAQKTMDAALGATRAHSSKLTDRASRLERDEYFDKTANLLDVMPAQIEAGAREQAQSNKEKVLGGVEQRISQLRELQGELGKEKQAIEQRGMSEVVGAIDGAASDALVANVGKAIGESVQNKLPGIMAKAAQNKIGEGDGEGEGTEGGMGAASSKLAQYAENIAAGRPGSGIGALAGRTGIGGLPTGVGEGLLNSRFSAINALAIEKYGKDLRERTKPDEYYKTAEETGGLGTRAEEATGTEIPEWVVVSGGTKDKGAENDVAKERKVPDPEFKTIAFAAAAMVESPLVIDGDLSDWGELRHPIPTRFRADGSSVQDPTNVYIRWSPDGLYLAYVAKKHGPIVPNAHAGDCLELWIDGENVRRKLMKESKSAQQIFIAPFGFRAERGPAIIEVGRDQRGLKMFTSYVDRSGEMGRVAAKEEGDSYTVEAFVSRKQIARPNLVPGAYLAINFSVNRTANEWDNEQWSSPKSHMTWDKPDTWGDVLLLGSDGENAFVSMGNPESPAEPLLPGQPLAFEIRDKDMDLNPEKIDRLPAVLRPRGENEGLFVILEESSPSSGVFRASVNTQHFTGEPKANTLNIRGGQTIELMYTDQRAEFGESNRTVTAEIAVASPALRLTSAP